MNQNHFSALSEKFSLAGHIKPKCNALNQNSDFRAE